MLNQQNYTLSLILLLANESGDLQPMMVRLGVITRLRSCYVVVTLVLLEQAEPSPEFYGYYSPAIMIKYSPTVICMYVAGHAYRNTWAPQGI